ncbi:MAG: ATPase, T2SS/T4P/T4SS family [Longimicrobiales bacterium]
MLHRIVAADLELGIFPRRFCYSRLVLPVRSRGGRPGIIVSNPFDWSLWDALEHTPYKGSELDVFIAAPDAIRKVFDYGDAAGGAVIEEPRDLDEDHPVARLAMALLNTAVVERASDIHIEPKPGKALIRGRIDGEMTDLEEIDATTCVMLISRFKALAGMDISERRKPQDGGMEVKVQGRPFKLRLATSSTPHGQSMVIRLLEPTAEPKSLEELGMTAEQARTLRDLASRNQGLILLVGPTGSGKSTTIYSLLSHLDTRKRSLMSVEDPVEYRIAFANQQQVNVGAGVTFESLLKSAVRQDPDILLLGEMRDLFSAKASMDFASSGHLTITSMHSSNSTTAIFRLERLGVSRSDMSEALIGIVAQKLVKRLCDACKVVRDITPEEAEFLAPYTDDVPTRVADPGGCDACRNTGYHGREGVYEVLRFDAALAEEVRSGVPVSEIRRFARSRGDFFISDHGVEKIRSLLVPVRMIYEKILVEESVALREADDVLPAAAEVPPAAAEVLPAAAEVPPAAAEVPPAAAEVPPAAAEIPRPAPGEAPTPRSPAAPPPVGSRTPDPGADAITQGAARILVAEDDPDTRTLLARLLENAGFEVLLAEDGVDALLKLGRSPIDLILSDINMPNLDGLKLLEIVNQHGSNAPVVFLSAESDPEVELQGLQMGAADFIRKPIQKEVLLHRVRRVLASRDDSRAT